MYSIQKQQSRDSFHKTSAKALPRVQRSKLVYMGPTKSQKLTLYASVDSDARGLKQMRQTINNSNPSSKSSLVELRENRSGTPRMLIRNSYTSLDRAPQMLSTQNLLQNAANEHNELIKDIA